MGKCVKQNLIYLDEFKSTVDNIVLEAVAKQININDFINERHYLAFVLPKKLQDELLLRSWVKESIGKMLLYQCEKVLERMIR